MTEIDHIGDAAFSSGDLMRNQRTLQADVRQLQTGRRLPSASIGAGGLRVFGGGSVTVDGGGDFVASNGSSIKALYAGGEQAVSWGTLVGSPESSAPGLDLGHGIVVQDVNGVNVVSLSVRPDGTREVVNGSELGNLGAFWAISDQINLGTAAHPAEEIIVLGDLIQIGHSDVPADQIRIRSADIVMGMPDPGGSRFSLNAGNAFMIAGGTSDVVLDAGSGDYFLANMSTGSGTNVIYTGVRIAEETSARRFKTDIRDFHIPSRAIFDLKPRTWRDRGEVERDPATDRWNVGYIAEELDEIGLGAFVNYDKDGAPFSIAYDRLVLPAIEEIKTLRHQVDSLTAWAATQGFQPPERPSVEATALPKRKPTDTTAPARSDPSESDRPIHRSDPRS
jgi:hypothetical protein